MTYYWRWIPSPCFSWYLASAPNSALCVLHAQQLPCTTYLVAFEPPQEPTPQFAFLWQKSRFDRECVEIPNHFRPTLAAGLNL